MKEVERKDQEAVPGGLTDPNPVHEPLPPCFPPYPEVPEYPTNPIGPIVPLIEHVQF
jgi:hypothetical protein